MSYGFFLVYSHRMKKKRVHKPHSVKEEISKYLTWEHPGGKLRDVGPQALTETELLAILISTGCKGKSALEVANDLLMKYGSLDNLSSKPLSELLSIKGLGDTKIIRIAAALELAKRTSEKLLSKPGHKK